MAERNVAALRSVYWLLLISGFVEPLLYLLSIGVGVGALVGDLAPAGGQVVSLPGLRRPGDAGSSAMTGALAETNIQLLRQDEIHEAVRRGPRHPGAAVRDRPRRVGLGDDRGAAPTPPRSWW